MAKILVFAEHRNGKLKKGAFEIIAACSKAGHETAAALFIDQPGELPKELGQYGAKKVFVVTHASLKNYLAETNTQAMLEVIKTFQPEYIMASHSPTGRDLMPRLSARIDAGLASDCTAVSLTGTITAKRPVYAGKAIAEVEFMGSGVKLLSIRPNSLGSFKPDTSQSAEVVNVNATITNTQTQFIEAVAAPVARPDVTEASIVVSGGRAMKNAENFRILEELADTLGAAVGASRAAVDAGYRPHRDQVGQTGKVVSPSLYIACGISGAIQHLAGMRTSKTIVAVNTDGEAPIFQLADYGIVEDLFKMVPLLTQEFKKLKES